MELIEKTQEINQRITEMEENNQRKPARKSTTIRKKKDTEENKKPDDSKVSAAKTPLVISRKKPCSLKTKTKDI